jgi:hypothetical protein
MEQGRPAQWSNAEAEQTSFGSKVIGRADELLDGHRKLPNGEIIGQAVLKTWNRLRLSNYLQV